MGSWSESCGFSGIEIGEQEDAYVMLLKGPQWSESHGPYVPFVPLTVPLRGSYNDYGCLSVEDDQAILDIFNKQSGLSLSNDDDFGLDALDGKADVFRFWIRADIFDRLDEIQHDFPYVFLNGGSVKVSNIREALDMTAAKKLEDYNKAATKIAELKEEGGTDSDIAISLSLMRMDFSYSSKPSTVFYNKEEQRLIREGGDPTALFAAQRRNNLLEWAASELRKKIVPSEGIGPQHNGERASKQFAKLILDIQAERAKGRGMEDEDEDSAE